MVHFKKSIKENVINGTHKIELFTDSWNVILVKKFV